MGSILQKQQVGPGKSGGINRYDINAKMKSLFIYNFTRYIKWPDYAITGDFVIGIFGSYPTLKGELETMARTKKFQGKSIVVKEYYSVDRIDACHILYVIPEKSPIMNLVNKEVQRKPILVLTDYEGMIKQGSSINFYYSQNKQRMEISPTNIEKCGLLVSSKLLSLAKVVQKY